MKINAKTAYRFAKFAKDNVRPILSNILIEKNRMVATDAYKLLIIEPKETIHNKENQLLDMQEFIKTYKNTDKLIETETIGVKENDVFTSDYPDYRAIMPKDKADIEISFDAKILIECLEQFKEKDFHNRVILKITKDKPLVMTVEHKKETITVLAMPLKS